MRTTSSIQFYCRKSKANREGLSPLEVSVSISGQRKFLNLPMKFRSEDFNKRKPSPEIVEALDLWRNMITQYQIQMLKEGIPYTAGNLRTVIQNGGVKAYTVGDLFNDYLKILKSRVGIDLKESVYRKYELVAEKALTFCHKDEDVSFLTPHLIQTIISDWRRVYDPSTLCGYLTRLKTFCKFGMDNGYIKVNPFQGVKISKPIKPIKSLTEEEVKHLLTLNLDRRLQKVLDCFLAQCGSGVAYADLVNLTSDDLKQVGNFYYISKERVKTGKTFTAIVFPWAADIIFRYGKLPVPSNQVYNRYLKEIDQRLTTHMGRRTYATMLANKGVSMETVAVALGDNTQIAARYYARVFDSTVIQQQISALK